jgi:hypothetical protein
VAREGAPITGIAEIARHRRHRKSQTYRGEAEKIGNKSETLITDEHRLTDLKTAKAIYQRGHRGDTEDVKPVLRQGATIYRYFLTMDGMVQCLRLSTMKM